jgi:hypothetical protein
MLSRSKYIFFTSKSPDRPGVHPVVSGISSPKLRVPEAEADHSRPYKAEVKNEWSYVSTLPCAFMTNIQNLLSLLLRSWAAHTKAAEETLFDQVAGGQTRSD